MKNRKPLFLGVHDFVRDHVNTEGEVLFARRLLITIVLWCVFFGRHFVTTVESMKSSPVFMLITDAFEGLSHWGTHKEWDQVPTTGFLCEFLASIAIFFIVSYTIDPILAAIERVMRSNYEDRAYAPSFEAEEDVKVGTFERFVGALCLMGWADFELFVGNLLRKEGFSVTHTHPEDHILSAALAEPQLDGGVDIEAEKASRTMLVQCKAWPDEIVGVATLEHLLKAMEAAKASGACFTILGFSDEARQFAKSNKIEIYTATNLAKKFFALSKEDQTEIKEGWPMPVVGLAENLRLPITQRKAEDAIHKVIAII